MPYERSCGGPPSSTASAARTTSGSTQPPVTDPAISPVSLSAMRRTRTAGRASLDGDDGRDRRPVPARAHRSSVGRTSRMRAPRNGCRKVGRYASGAATATGTREPRGRLRFRPWTWPHPPISPPASPGRTTSATRDLPSRCTSRSPCTAPSCSRASPVSGRRRLRGRSPPHSAPSSSACSATRASTRVRRCTSGTTPASCCTLARSRTARPTRSGGPPSSSASISSSSGRCFRRSAKAPARCS